MTLAMSDDLFDLNSQKLKILYSALSMDLFDNFILPGIEKGSASEEVSILFCSFLFSNFNLDLNSSQINQHFISPVMKYCSKGDMINFMNSNYSLSIHHFTFKNSLQLYLSPPPN